jgi:hypothetical protein
MAIQESRSAFVQPIFIATPKPFEEKKEKIRRRRRRGERELVKTINTVERER